MKSYATLCHMNVCTILVSLEPENIKKNNQLKNIRDLPKDVFRELKMLPEWEVKIV